MQGLNVAIYLRKSRADVEEEMKAAARGEKYDTLGKHRRQLLDVARRDGHNVLEIYEEVVSGEFISERAEMQRMLKDIKNMRYEAILVVAIDRLGRGDKVDQGRIERALKESGTIILTPNEYYDLNQASGEFNVEVSTFLSRMEYRQIKQRLQAGRLSSSAAGRDIGNKPPYGYRKDDNLKLVIQEDEAQVVRKIFRLCNEGYGRVQIAQHLTDEGIPSPAGLDHWGHATVLRILKNPKYKGDMVFGRNQFIKLEDGTYKKRVKLDEKRIAYATETHEPIVSPEIWLQAQDSIKQRTAPTNRNSDLVNVFAGIIKCKKCGKAILANKPKNRPNTYLYCGTAKCETKMTTMDKVEHEVIVHLEKMLERIKLQEKDFDMAENRTEQEEIISRIHGVEHEIESDAERRNNLHDLLESGVYDKETFLERMNHLQVRAKDYELELKSLRDQLHRIEERAKQKKDMKPLLISVLDAYKNSPTIAGKNKILRQIISRIEYRREKDWKAPDDFELDIYLLE